MMRWISIVVLVGVFYSPCLAADDTVRVELLGRLDVSAGVIKVADIARVSGGDLITRRKIAKLDMADFDAVDSLKRLTRRQVQLRILLAGFPKRSFRIEGAETVVLQVTKAASPETRVLDLLKPEIAGRLGVSPEDIAIRLTKPIPANADPYFASSYTLEHALPDNLMVGSFTTRIRIRDQERLVRTISTSIEVQVYQNVFVAQRHLEPGTALAETDVIQERRLVTDRGTYATKTIFGKQLKRRIAKGAIVTTLDLNKPKKQKAEIIIKSRDIVEIVARGSGLQARISGAIAMQRGAIGDNIRVKNPSSGRILNAKVISSGVVEIRL